MGIYKRRQGWWIQYCTPDFLNPAWTVLYIVLTGCTSQPIEHVQVNNDKFLDIYGDCYISGILTKFLYLQAFPLTQL